LINDHDRQVIMYNLIVRWMFILLSTIVSVCERRDWR